ncbi:hypothetical protein RvY_06115-2 [Ramazzottius varieornatus]|uniref:Guanylate cyclase domain-containing protein n=1 Tax=Ramazzottius varieornatus TaxID=947166 RepID=A0A1D1UXX2_RAMVA|nr:hypothetical protein RvY_06115-2 [Ramazzottius varieornatus]
METLNLMHRVFDEIVEKNGRVYRLHWDGATVVAVGGVPFGLELDPVHSIAQIAFEYMIWAYNSRTPFNQPLKLRFGIHSGAVSAGCLDYSAPHYVLFGDLMKTAYLIETASRPYRILVSEDFNDQLKKLAKVYVRYRVIEASHPVRGYDKRTFWLIGSNYFEQQYLLDDILYGKDELDTQGNDFVPYNTEEGIINDNHASQVEALDGKDIHGTFHPSVLESAAVIRALKKRKAGIMKVPPAHVLNAQILRVSKDGKRYFQGQEKDLDHSYVHHHHDQDENLEDLPPTPADVLVGIYQRTEVREAPEAAEESGPLLQKLRLEDNPLLTSDKTKRRQVDSRIQALRSEPSFLSSIRSEQVSAGSGETSQPVRGRLDVLHTPAFGGLLHTAVDSQKSVAKLEETPIRPYVATSKTDHRRLLTATSGDAVTTTFSAMDSEYILDPEQSNVSFLAAEPDHIKVEPVVEVQKEASVADVVVSLAPSDLSQSRSSFNTQASASSFLSSMTVLSSALPRHGIRSREIEEQPTKLVVPVGGSPVRHVDGKLPNQRDFHQTTEELNVPLPAHRPEVVIGTVERVSDDAIDPLKNASTEAIHVYADPPSMDSNLSNFAVTPSMMDHISRLKETNSQDFSPIEGTSEDFNERRDRMFQSIRNAEFHQTDSDSFKLMQQRAHQAAQHRNRHETVENANSQPSPDAELLSRRREEPTTLVVHNPLFEETSLRIESNEPEESHTHPQTNLLEHTVLDVVDRPTKEWSMESVELDNKQNATAPVASTQRAVDDALPGGRTAKVTEEALPGKVTARTTPPTTSQSNTDTEQHLKKHNPRFN